MNAPRTLLILVAATALIGVAEAQKGGGKPGGGSSTTSQFRIVDATGKIVTTLFAPHFTDHVHPILEAIVVVPIDGSSTVVSLSLSKNGFIPRVPRWTNERLFFSDVDCSGVRYLPMFEPFSITDVSLFPRVTEIERVNDAAVLYYSNLEATTQYMQVRSYLAYEEVFDRHECVNYPPDQARFEYVTEIAGQVDLDGIWQPPFSLVGG